MKNLSKAIDYAKAHGKAIKKKDLAAKIWEGSSDRSARVNFCNLEKGKVARVDERMVKILTDELGVSSDFLFGLSDIPNEMEGKNETKATIVEKINEINQLVETL